MLDFILNLIKSFLNFQTEMYPQDITISITIKILQCSFTNFYYFRDSVYCCEIFYCSKNTDCSIQLFFF